MLWESQCTIKQSAITMKRGQNRQNLMRSLLIFYTLFNTAQTLKILVYSAPLGFSHMQFMGAIADVLQEAGHDVTVLHPVDQPSLLHAVSKKSKRGFPIEGSFHR
ncbi:hypothetical protein COOONC_09786 [Cooperia oncophora]